MCQRRPKSDSTSAMSNPSCFFGTATDMLLQNQEYPQYRSIGHDGYLTCGFRKPGTYTTPRALQRNPATVVNSDTMGCHKIKAINMTNRSASLRKINGRAIIVIFL